jgi:dihydrofolate reductase
MTGPLPSAEVFVATSLDGYIARSDGDLGWLVDRPVVPGEDFGYKAFMAGIGALVMGRQTFDKVLTFPDWPYEVPVVVLSRSPEVVEVPGSLRDMVRVTSAAPQAVLEELSRQGVDRVYVDGGQIVRTFLAAGLIRRLIVTLVPVLLGQGRPLWGHGAGEVELVLRAVRHWENGFAQVEYAA